MPSNDAATMLKVFLGIVFAGPLLACQSPEPSSVLVTSRPVKTSGAPPEAGTAEAVLAANEAPSAAAEALGYRSIGVERDPRYAKMASAAIPQLAELSPAPDDRNLRLGTLLVD